MRTKIVEILKRCGLSQQEIADRLGVAKSLVSMWIHGTRDIPPKYEGALLKWLPDAQQAAIEHARALDDATPARSRSLLTENLHVNRLREDLELLWHDYTWQVEEDLDRGLTARLVGILRTLAPYAEADPATTELKPAELDKLWADTKKIRGIISTFRRLSAQPPTAEEADHAC